MAVFYHKGLQLDDDEYLKDYGCGPEEAKCDLVDKFEE